MLKLFSLTKAPHALALLDQQDSAAGPSDDYDDLKKPTLDSPLFELYFPEQLVLELSGLIAHASAIVGKISSERAQYSDALKVATPIPATQKDAWDNLLKRVQQLPVFYREDSARLTDLHDLMDSNIEFISSSLDNASFVPSPGLTQIPYVKYVSKDVTVVDFILLNQRLFFDRAFSLSSLVYDVFTRVIVDINHNHQRPLQDSEMLAMERCVDAIISDITVVLSNIKISKECLKAKDCRRILNPDDETKYLTNSCVLLGALSSVYQSAYDSTEREVNFAFTNPLLSHIREKLNRICELFLSIFFDNLDLLKDELLSLALTVLSQSWLANMGAPGQAQLSDHPHYSWVLKMQTALGPHHPHHTNLFERQALFFARSGNFDQAYRHCNLALDHATQIGEPIDPFVAESIHLTLFNCNLHWYIAFAPIVSDQSKLLTQDTKIDVTNYLSMMAISLKILLELRPETMGTGESSFSKLDVIVNGCSRFRPPMVKITEGIIRPIDTGRLAQKKGLKGRRLHDFIEKQKESTLFVQGKYLWFLLDVLKVFSNILSFAPKRADGHTTFAEELHGHILTDIGDMTEILNVCGLSVDAGRTKETDAAQMAAFNAHLDEVIAQQEAEDKRRLAEEEAENERFVTQMMKREKEYAERAYGESMQVIPYQPSTRPIVNFRSKLELGKYYLQRRQYHRAQLVLLEAEALIYRQHEDQSEVPEESRSSRSTSTEIQLYIRPDVDIPDIGDRCQLYLFLLDCERGLTSITQFGPHNERFLAKSKEYLGQINRLMSEVNPDDELKSTLITHLVILDGALRFIQDRQETLLSRFERELKERKADFAEFKTLPGFQHQTPSEKAAAGKPTLSWHAQRRVELKKKIERCTEYISGLKECSEAALGVKITVKGPEEQHPSIKKTGKKGAKRGKAGKGAKGKKRHKS